MKPTFFEWVAQCLNILGWPLEKGEELLPKSDPCWFYAWDDGLTAAQAVHKYKAQQKEIMPLP